MKALKIFGIATLLIAGLVQSREGSQGSERMFNLLANYVRVDHAMGGKAYIGLFDGLSCDQSTCDLRGEGTIVGDDARELFSLLVQRGVHEDRGQIKVSELICRSVLDDENGDYLFNCDIVL